MVQTLLFLIVHRVQFILAGTVNEIKKGGLAPRRPCLARQEIFPELVTLIEDCWSENPQVRPSVGFVRKICFSIKRFVKVHSSIFFYFSQYNERTWYLISYMSPSINSSLMHCMF